MAFDDRELAERFRIERLADSEFGPEDVIALWLREGVLPEEVARERVKQVAFIAAEREAGLIGLSTTYLDANEQLRMRLWHYRTFIAAAHRDADLGRHLLYETISYLQGRWSSGEDERAPGMMIELENEMLKRIQNRASWRLTQFHFIGESERGAHLRVRYFPGAEAPRPGAEPGYAG